MQSTRTCSIDGCKATCQARGLCSKHYYRIRANGSPHRETDLPLDERFELCVDKHGPVPQHRTDLGNCWEWTRGVSGDGYGVLKKSGKIIKMHRWAYAHFVSPISPGKQVDHMCWNRRCVNPTHLREVSQKENRENLGNLLANNTTGYHGVSFHKGHGKYVARVRNNGKSVYIGAFSTAEEAGEAARLARMTMFTHNDLDRITELTED